MFMDLFPSFEGNYVLLELLLLNKEDPNHSHVDETVRQDAKTNNQFGLSHVKGKL